MVWKDLIYKSKNLIDSLGHFKRLGKIARQRNFLVGERKKFLIKLGERSLELLHAHKIHSEDLTRLATQIAKIEKLLKQIDFGGQEGVNFVTGSLKPKKYIKKDRK